MRAFVVQQPMILGYGSHTRALSPSRYKEIQPGAILLLDSEAPNGNVWFVDRFGDRGKIECGVVVNLVKNGRVGELAPGECVIFSASELTASGAGFWSNSDGWTTLAEATRFKEGEMVTLTLPLAGGGDARWVTRTELCETQIEQMKGPFPDEDGAIAQALERADIASADYHRATAVKSHRPKG